MRDARALLLGIATLLGWASLTLASLVSAQSAGLAVAAAVLSSVVWIRRWAAVGAAALVVAAVVLLSTGRAPVVALLCGVSLLLYVVLVDLSEHSTGASARAIAEALWRFAPGTVAAVAAGVLVVAAGTVAGAFPSVPALTVTAPWLLIVAVLTALGLSTRRGFWTHLVRYGRLSATTKRYLERAGLRL